MTSKPAFSLRKRIYVIFVLCVLLPVMFLSAFLSVYFTRRFSVFARENAANTLLTSAKSIEGYLNELERIAFTPYLYKDVFEEMRLLNRSVSTGGLDILTRNRLEENYSMIFTKLLHTTSPMVYRIEFYPFAPEKNLCYSIAKNRAGLQVEEVEPFSESEWFLLASEQGGQLFYTPIRPTEESGSAQGKDSFSAVRMIRDTDTNRDIGVMKLDVSPSVITDVLDDITLSENSRLLLMSTQNELLYSAKPVTPELLHFAAGDAPQNTGGRFYMESHSIGKTGWKLVSLTARSDIILSNTSTFLLIALVAVVATCGAFAVYRYHSKHMMTALSAILHTISEIEKGSPAVVCTVQDDSELAVIASALTRMSGRLERHLDKEYRAIINQRNAEYLALQSQINPHFLYNTLNGFIALNRMGEQKLLEKNIIELTRLFRYTCDNHNTAALGDELAFIGSYLALQKLRFEERLNFTFSVENGAESLPIPKLLLQPLVENSVIHGMRKSGEPMRIHIACQRSDRGGKSGLLLLTEDDGAGFNSDAEINNTTHVGLANVMERVVYFNKRGTFEIESEVGTGTRCSIWFPDENAKGAGSHADTDCG